MGARDVAPEAERKLLLSNEPSPANIAALKALIRERAPRLAGLSIFTESGNAEFAKYFTRRTYRGAVVHVNRLNEGEWICLLGDSAHSVLPPTGEGINSGLEDALLLANCVRSSPSTAFGAYNSLRITDVQALGEYATYLNAMPSFSGERVARGIFMVLDGCCGSTNIADELFGPSGQARKPYGEIVASWKSKQAWLLNLARLFTYPICSIFWILSLPIDAVKFCCCREAEVDTRIKPPTGDAEDIRSLSESSPLLAAAPKSIA